MPQERGLCVSCPERGRVGEERNLKTPGSSYCAVCKREDARNRYQGKGSAHVRAGVPKLQAYMAHLRAALNEFDWVRVWGYMDLLDTKLLELEAEPVSRKGSGMSLGEMLQALQGFQPGTPAYTAYKASIREAYPDARLPGDGTPIPEDLISDEELEAINRKDG